MHHPLVQPRNPSLAPIGFVFTVQARRLKETLPGGSINRERFIAKRWTEANRISAGHPLPLHTIIHEILPTLPGQQRLETGDFEFDGASYFGRDIRFISTAVQWCGTNCGRVFLEDNHAFGSKHFGTEHEFTEKLKKYDMDLVCMWGHICVPACKERTIWPPTIGPVCKYNRDQVPDRDRMLAYALMRWLGQPAGREFVAHYVALRNPIQDRAHTRYMRKQFPGNDLYSKKKVA